MSEIRSLLERRQRWLVIGASGFIGTNLCKTLLAMGHEVIAYGRNNQAPQRLDGCIWKAGDLTDRHAIASAMEGVHYVVHAASSMTPAASNENPVTDISDNLIGAVNLFEAAHAAAVRRLVVLSSGGTVYGPDVPVPTNEEAPNNPICSYGIVKLAIEKYATLYRQLGKLDSVVLRISNPFGPYQTGIAQGMIGASIMRILKGQAIDIWGDGTVIRDFIYIDDVVSAILHSVRLDNARAPHVYNIGSGIGRSLNRVVETLAAIHGYFEVKRQSGRSVDVPVSVLDIKLAESFLGWQPTSEWETSVTRTYQWHKEQFSS